MSEAYHTKHRPISFEAVRGQGHVLPSLQSVLDKGTSHAFLFSGPAGTGKTTLARICAGYVDCEPRDIMEVDAATFSGVDKMREIQLLMKYRPIGAGGSRGVILDEAHGLSKQAWDTLLKAVEEPNPNVYWFFCTTNVSKVPKTIRTRCAEYVLKAVNDNDLEKVVRRVMKKENLTVPDGVIQIICREAGGSPRQALTNLAMAAHCKTGKEAAALLHSAQDSEPVLELCRFLVAGGSWGKAMDIVSKFDNEGAEGVRIVVANYMSSVLKGTNNDKKAMQVLHILEQFSEPYNSSENFAPLILSVGRVLYSGD